MNGRKPFVSQVRSRKKNNEKAKMLVLLFSAFGEAQTKPHSPVERKNTWPVEHALEIGMLQPCEIDSFLNKNPLLATRPRMSHDRGVYLEVVTTPFPRWSVHCVPLVGEDLVL